MFKEFKDQEDDNDNINFAVFGNDYEPIRPVRELNGLNISEFMSSDSYMKEFSFNQIIIEDFLYFQRDEDNELMKLPNWYRDLENNSEQTNKLLDAPKSININAKTNSSTNRNQFYQGENKEESKFVNSSQLGSRRIKEELGDGNFKNVLGNLAEITRRNGRNQTYPHLALKFTRIDCITKRAYRGLKRLCRDYIKAHVGNSSLGFNFFTPLSDSE
jgi:hypothetical protein